MWAAQTVGVTALLDTGAAVNVLPFSIGTELGFLHGVRRLLLPLPVTSRSPAPVLIALAPDSFNQACEPFCISTSMCTL